jgi:hypothetical protein
MCSVHSLPERHFVHDKTHVDNRGIKHRPRRRERYENSQGYKALSL